MIGKIWKWMCRFKVDKLWHFIAFREFTTFLLKLGWGYNIVIIIVILLAIGKEIYDWYKGEGIDFGDLLADVLGITMAFIN